MAWKIDEFVDELEEDRGLRIVRIVKMNKYELHDIPCDYDSEGRVRPYEHHRWYDPKGSDDEYSFDECDEYIDDLKKIKIPKYILEEVRKYAKSQDWQTKDALK